MSVREAATLANVTVRQINRLICQGTLRATFSMKLKQYEISDSDFAVWQQTRRKPGRPKQD